MAPADHGLRAGRFSSWSRGRSGRETQRQEHPAKPFIVIDMGWYIGGQEAQVDGWRERRVTVILNTPLIDTL